jgi:hypothetical protein
MAKGEGQTAVMLTQNGDNERGSGEGKGRLTDGRDGRGVNKEKRRGEGNKKRGTSDEIVDIERNGHRSGDNEATEADDESSSSGSDSGSNRRTSICSISKMDSPRPNDNTSSCSYDHDNIYHDNTNSTKNNTKIPHAAAAAFRKRILNFESLGYALVALGFCVCIPSVLLVMFAQQNLTYVPD